MNYYYEEEKVPPRRRLDEKRNFWKYFILNILTCGIYGLFFFPSISFDLDKIVYQNGEGKTFNYFFAWLLSYLPFGRIIMLIWYYQVSSHIEKELKKRDIDLNFGTSTFWGWAVIGGFFFLFGYIVFEYKLVEAMNILCSNYNDELDVREAEKNANR